MVPSDRSPGYGKLVALVNSYVKASQGAIATRKDKWNEAERNRKAYVNLKALDKKRLVDSNPGANGGEGSGYPGAVPIVVPIGYAMNMTTLSYLMSIFGSRNPIIPIVGNASSSGDARKMEALLQYQTSQMKYIMKLYLWFQDVLDYGIGATHNYWEVKKVNYVADANQMGMMGMVSKLREGMGLGPLPVKKQIFEGIGYEGNNCEVIDPYNLLVDPRFPISAQDKGDYIGYTTATTMTDLEALAANGFVVNIDKIKTSSRSGTSGGGNSSRDSMMGTSRQNHLRGKGVVDVHKLYIKLSPKEYELDTSSSTSLWEIWSASNQIIRCELVSNAHNQDMITLLEYNPDGHSLFNLGQSELMSGLQQHLSWLFNSHMDNVRKSLNDVLIVDPSRINMKDLTDPEPGKLIRLLESAYGQDVRSMIHQLPVQDVTQGHLQKVSIIIDLMQRVSAATDNMMGLPNFGRRTATEIRNIQVMAGGRMKTFAEVCHAMGIQPQHRQFITNTQQFMSMEVAVQIVGENGDYSGVSTVSPRDILGEFHIPPADGTLPTDRLALADTYREIFNTITSSPAAPILMSRFNVVSIFENICSLLGARDIQKFINQPNPAFGMAPGIMPNEQIDAQVQQGNMVPMDLASELGNMGGQGDMDGGTTEMIEQMLRRVQQ